MKTFVAGLNISITVPFLWDGEPFVPDNGTFSYDLRGQDGSLIQTNVVVGGVTNTSAIVTISQTLNQIASGHDFEKRMLVFYANLNGSPWTYRLNYRLCPWLNFTATGDDVRSFIGIGSGELPDRDIDLVAAYLDCLGYIDDNNTAFESALISGGDLERQANRAIVAQAVILAMPSLQTRISQMENDGNMSAQRFQIDFSDLESRASDQLSRAINLITGRLLVAPSMTAVAYDMPDPFMGSPRFYWRIG